MGWSSSTTNNQRLAVFTLRHFISSLACFSIVGWGNVTSTANDFSVLLNSYCIWWTGLCKVGKKTLNNPRLGSCQLVKTMRLIKVDLRSGPRPPLVRTEWHYLQCEGSVGVVTRWRPQRTAATKVTQVTTDKLTNKTHLKSKQNKPFPRNGQSVCCVKNCTEWVKSRMNNQLDTPQKLQVHLTKAVQCPVAFKNITFSLSFNRQQTLNLRS